MLKTILKHVMIAFAMVSMSLGLLGVPSFAQDVTTALPSNNAICADGARGRLIGCDESDLAALAGNVAGLMTFIIVSISIVFILYGAFVWLTQSNDKGPETGRKIIVQSVIALVISVVAYGVVASLINFISNTQL